MQRYRYEGTSDEVTACECCGKTGLKSTVAITDLDTDQTLYFGTTCAARALRVQVADVRAGTRAADDAKAAERSRAQRAAHQAQAERWHAYLVARTGGLRGYDGTLDVFAMIQSLGGYAKAREGFVW
jgi:hypothetical protein